MGDGKALQMGTSHELGQNFAKAFGTQYADASGELRYVWQTSWGASTRLIGALIMAHGDDFGLRLPPALAPLEVVVLCVRDDEAVRSAASALTDELRRAGRRVHLDDRTETGFGRRTVDWELKGVPVRIEIGPRDLADGNVTIVTRHLRTKEAVGVSGAVDAVERICRRAGNDLREEALAFREARTVSAGSVKEVVDAGAGGFVRLPWRHIGEDGELELAGEGLTVRCLQREDEGLARPGEADDDLVAVVGRSY